MTTKAKKDITQISQSDAPNFLSRETFDYKILEKLTSIEQHLKEQADNREVCIHREERIPLTYGIWGGWGLWFFVEDFLVLHQKGISTSCEAVAKFSIPALASHYLPATLSNGQKIGGIVFSIAVVAAADPCQRFFPSQPYTRYLECVPCPLDKEKSECLSIKHDSHHTTQNNNFIIPFSITAAAIIATILAYKIYHLQDKNMQPVAAAPLSLGEVVEAVGLAATEAVAGYFATTEVIGATQESNDIVST